MQQLWAQLVPPPSVYVGTWPSASAESAAAPASMAVAARGVRCPAGVGRKGYQRYERLRFACASGVADVAGAAAARAGPAGARISPTSDVDGASGTGGSTPVDFSSTV